MNTQNTNTKLIETYKGIRIYKEKNYIFSNYLICIVNDKEYLNTEMKNIKNHITRELNKLDK